MDPASVVTLAGACLTLIARTSRDINELVTKAKNVDRASTFILGRLATVRATIGQLQSWVEGENEIHEQTLSDLRSAIGACEVVVGEIYAHVRRVNSGWLGGSLRHLWDEGQLQAHQEALDSQTAALGIFLNALLLKSATQQRQLLESLESRLAIKTAQDNASVYTSSSRELDGRDDTNPAFNNIHFGFDNDLIGSNTYRRAMALPLPRSTSLPTLPQSIGNDSGINVDSQTITTVSSASTTSTKSSFGSGLNSGSKSWRTWASKSRTATAKKLCEAAWRGDAPQVVKLCNEGSDVNCRSNINRPSSNDDNLRILKSLSLLRRKPNRNRTSVPATPLHYAAETGQLDIIRILVSHQANVNSRIEDGKAPVHVADGEAVTLLVSLGADPKIKDASGSIALHYAAANGNIEAVRVLLRSEHAVHEVNNCAQTPLHFACNEGQTEVVSVLLEAGSYKNPPDDNGLRPLHYAADKGHVEIIQLLLQTGSDIEAPSKQRLTALHCSAGQGHTEATEALITAGAQIEAVAERKRTPLHLAIENSKDKVVKLLLRSSANVEAETAEGKRPLDLAICSVSRDIVEALIEHGADVSSATKGADTHLLTICSTPGPIEHVIAIARILIQRGANVNSKNNAEQSPLSAACSRVQSALDLVRLLLQNNAVVRSADFLALWGNGGVSLWEKRVIHAALNEAARPELRRDEVEWQIMLI